MVSNKPLKIGLVLDDSLDKPDGVQQYVLGIGAWLSEQGHDVHYLVGQTTRTDINNIHSLSKNVNVRFNGNRMSIPLPTSRNGLHAFLATQQFDILHVQVPYSPWLAQRLILAAGQHTAIIGTFHIVANSKIVSLSSTVLGKWTRRSLKRFDTIVSVSSAAQEYAKKTYRISTTVLPNVFDYDRFHTALAFDKYNDSKLNILFLGRLVPRKGCAVLLQAVAQLAARDDVPAFRVLVCGKGPLNDQLQHYVKDNGLAQVVEFVGFVSEEEKPRYYASADIAVFPSSGGESFGIVLLEAMANGRTAVLAGDNSGYHSVLGDQPDLLFEPRDAVLLADKLHYFLNDTAARRNMGEWGQSYTRSFDTAVVGEKLSEIYVQALHKRAQQ